MPGNLTTGSMSWSTPAVLHLFLLVLDPRCTTSTTCRVLFFLSTLCFGGSGRIQITMGHFGHSHLVPMSPALISIPAQEDTRGCFWVCTIRYCRWHGLIPERYGSALWFSLRVLPNTSECLLLPLIFNTRSVGCVGQGQGQLALLPGPAAQPFPALGLSKLAAFWVPESGWNSIPRCGICYLQDQWRPSGHCASFWGMGAVRRSDLSSILDFPGYLMPKYLLTWQVSECL